MTYVDGFIVPVPKKKLAAYRAMAKKVGKVWMEYGALSYVECVADDVRVGKRTSLASRYAPSVCARPASSG